MTTIITDGNFIIADKRTSGVWSPGSSSCRSKKRPAKVATDVTEKIVILEHKEPVTFKNKKVVAMAFSGSVNVGDQMISVVKKTKVINHYFDQLSVMPTTNHTATSFILVFEDGSSQVIRTSILPNKEKIHINYLPVETVGNFSSIGSGSGLYKVLLPYFPKDIKEKITLLDLFFFMVHTDEASSDNYDVFCMKERKLVRNCKPTKAAVLESVLKIQSLLDFTLPVSQEYHILELEDLQTTNFFYD